MPFLMDSSLWFTHTTKNVHPNSVALLHSTLICNVTALRCRMKVKFILNKRYGDAAVIFGRDIIDILAPKSDCGVIWMDLNSSSNSVFLPFFHAICLNWEYRFSEHCLDPEWCNTSFVDGITNSWGEGWLYFKWNSLVHKNVHFFSLCQYNI